MNNEIKEILSLIPICDYKKLSVDEIVILENYIEDLLCKITNLQEENKKLSKEIKNIEKEDDEIRVKNSFLVNGFHELDIRIDKAIEYIENCPEYLWSNVNTKVLLNILQGSDKDDKF